MLSGPFLKKKKLCESEDIFSLATVLLLDRKYPKLSSLKSMVQNVAVLFSRSVRVQMKKTWSG